MDSVNVTMNGYKADFTFYEPEPPKWHNFLVWSGIICACLLFWGVIVNLVFAQDIDVNKLADAIYIVEGGNKTNFPYGIKSLKYDNRTDRSLTKNQWARKICINTIMNNIKRFNNQSEYVDFISFLGSKYCPTTIPAEYQLNKHWVSNVRYHYKRMVQNDKS